VVVFLCSDKNTVIYETVTVHSLDEFLAYRKF